MTTAPLAAMRRLDLYGAADTARLAAAFAALARPGDTIALKGELGAGKTCFARAFIQCLAPGEEVPSPTFTLVQTYDTPAGTVWHFDLFRLAGADEALELGLEEAAAGIALIEWPERAAGLLPRDRLEIEFAFDADADADPDTRRVRLIAHGTWARRLERLHP